MSVHPLDGGRNSRVYVARSSDGERFLVKRFIRRGFGGRDPMTAEFAALRLLWGRGVQSIPRPVALDNESGYSVYTFVDGEPANSAQVTADDIDQAADFLGTLRNLADSPGSGEIADASEACFSVRDIIDNINLRLARLQDVEGNSEQSFALHRFLDDRFLPLFDAITMWAETGSSRNGRTLETTLAAKDRTLSPSDFGFHNALRTDNGLVFLDFEHFGWDDPAKTISDFVMHPAMDLSQELKQRFISRAVSKLGESSTLAHRLPVAYPLYGLKWCMILLNEFLVEGLTRREFAAGRPLEAATLQAGQLAKAEDMLQRMIGEYEHFPYKV